MSMSGLKLAVVGWDFGRRQDFGRRDDVTADLPTLE
jgi:hypothetical protein